MRFIIITFFLFTSLQNFGQSLKISSLITDFNKNGEIEGIVLDGENDNEPLFFAEIFVKENNTSATTDLDGTFNLSLKPGKYTLVISFMGYKTIEVSDVIITSNKTLQLNQVLKALNVASNITAIYSEKR